MQSTHSVMFTVFDQGLVDKVNPCEDIVYTFELLSVHNRRLLRQVRTCV